MGYYERYGRAGPYESMHRVVLDAIHCTQQKKKGGRSDSSLWHWTLKYSFQKMNTFMNNKVTGTIRTISPN